MQARFAKRMALGVIVAVAAVTGLGAGSASSAKFRIPEEPDVTAPARAGQAGPDADVAIRRVVSLGYDRRCGREVYTFKTGKRQSIPFC